MPEDVAWLVQVVQQLLKEGASINAEDDDGLTPLMDTVMGGHTLVSQLLRFNKANLGPKIMVCIQCYECSQIKWFCMGLGVKRVFSLSLG